MMRYRAARWVVVLPTVAMVLMACVGGQSKQANFYTLTSEPEIGGSAGATEVGGRAVLALGPVRLPDYLLRPQIVTRSEGTRLERADFERWAGSLEELVEGALVANLSSELQDMAVLGHRQALVEPAYRVSIDIEELLGRLDGYVDLRANWVLVSRSPSADPIRQLNSSQIRVPIAEPGYPALVEAHEEALRVLGGQIAEAVRGL